MKKIPTIFVRDFNNRGQITNQWHPDCLWVRDGEGIATRKWDGTSCLWKGGKLWKRREIPIGQAFPDGFVPVDGDEETKKHVGWMPLGDGPDDQWHREALAPGQLLTDGRTYELIGPKVNGNKDKALFHVLVPHGDEPVSGDPRTYAELSAWLATHEIEGVVWRHPDGRMAKIKRRDFGLKW
jgi:hypothetical protein